MQDRDRNRGEELLILQRAVENTNEAFVTMDENHRVLFFNKAAEKIFGYSRAEVVGHDLDVIMTPSCSRNHREAVNRYIKTRAPAPIVHVSEVMAGRKDGSTFPASISFSVTQVNGKLFFTAIVRDLTETRALQERIISSERLAALGRLVAEITHEIKNPLVMIGGFARQLIRTSRNDKEIKKLNIIAEEVRRLEKLLADLGQVYRPKKRVVKPVDMKRVMEEIFSLTKADIQERNIRPRMLMKEGLPPVAGDPDRLKQVFLNLVKNSVEAMGNGGKLSVEARTMDENLEIHLTDEGCGIPKRDLDKIFSPFYTTKKHGTGLGLSICKRILEESENCSLSVESEEGKGTKFTIQLPLYREEGRHTL